MGVKKSSTNLPGLLALPCATIIICHKGPGDCRLRSPNCQPEPFRGRVHTHTQEGGGWKEGTRTASHNQQRGNKRKKTGRGAHHTQAEQRKENGRAGEKAHRNPTLARRRASSAKRSRQQSKNTAARKLKPDSTGKEQTQLWGLGRKGLGGWEKREGRGEEQDRTRREGGVPGYANRIHEPTGKEEERCTQLYTRIQDRTNRLYGLFPSCDVFLSVTFTSNRNSHISAWSHIPTGNKSRQTSGYCSTPRYTGMAGYNSMHATERTDGTHKSVRLCPTHADDRVNKYSEKELCNDEVVVALKIPKDSSWQHNGRESGYRYLWTCNSLTVTCKLTRFLSRYTGRRLQPLPMTSLASLASVVMPCAGHLLVDCMNLKIPSPDCWLHELENSYPDT